MAHSLYETESITPERSSAHLTPLEELISFLKHYLGPDQARRFEKKANYHVLHPDADTKDFVDDVFKAINEKLHMDRRGLKEAAEKLINEYNKQMKKAKDCKRFGNELISHSCEQERTSAVKLLIEGLEPIIPEPKKSTFKVHASHVLAEDLDDFLNHIHEELKDFLEEREREVKRRLQVIIDAFLNELIEMSKQLRMVSKINFAVEALTEENVPEPTKAEIVSIAEQIMNNLRNNMMTPEVVEGILKLINKLSRLAESFPKGRLRNAAKELQKTADYLFGSRSSKSSNRCSRS